MNDVVRMAEVVAVCSLLLLAGCDQVPSLTNQQKFEMAKQCVDAGMWPDVYAEKVTCNAVGKLK